MTKKATASNKSYLITPSLLNSWAYIFLCVENVRENQKDEISLEDKQSDAQERAYQDFLKALNREPSEPNIYMQRGIEFEEECYKGNTVISPIIKGGAYQIVGKKFKTIAGINFLLYGRLDVLKGGVIYDIKRVSMYSPQKYQKSYQHPFYFELFSRANEFEYLAYDNYDKLHIETYYRDECVNIDSVIEQFINWLIEKGLINIYFEKWETKGTKK